VIERVGVVIPVHDEEGLLGACLESVQVAATAVAPRARVDIVVVLDACIDGSAAVAAQHPVEIVRISSRLVGAARRAGVARLGRRSGDATWIANTDADSVVPPTWLAHQLELADAGADVVLGPVRPDFTELAPAHVAYWLETHPPGVPTGNTHGANLGIRSCIYDLVGGFARVAEHEDVLLVARAREAGADVVSTADAEVVTSARFEGRTPGGYAGHLRRVAGEIALTAQRD
jgi:glycosyltransferase involved in cell wall biosynthesis